MTEFSTKTVDNFWVSQRFRCLHEFVI